MEVKAKLEDSERYRFVCSYKSANVEDSSHGKRSIVDRREGINVDQLT
jgi:hypothetical protein